VNLDVTGNSERWPHLEACYQLAWQAARGFAPEPCADVAFTAARWGLHMGMALARLAPEQAEAIDRELEGYDLERDGLEAATFARYSMLRDVQEIQRLARAFRERPE
jgi:hypothetical protein